MTLHYLTPHYIEIHDSMLHYITPQHNTTHYLILRHLTLHCITLPHIASHHITLEQIILDDMVLHHSTQHSFKLHLYIQSFHTYLRLHMYGRNWCSFACLDACKRKKYIDR